MQSKVIIEHSDLHSSAKILTRFQYHYLGCVLEVREVPLGSDGSRVPMGVRVRKEGSWCTLVIGSSSLAYWKSLVMFFYLMTDLQASCA